ncbi:MAG: FecR domain-containing protein [Saprospiraceae bacterium]|nr:FecR domain-containing protein [Saprospiraceae bacterium]
MLSEANERKIVLNGSAKFDVTKSILPFRVYNSGIIVEVLGTEFSITQENQKVIVENHSGSVQVLESQRQK